MKEFLNGVDYAKMLSIACFIACFLGTSCSNKRITRLKDIPYQSHVTNQNTLHQSRLPSTLGFIPDWNINNIASPSDISKISDIPQNWQYYEPVNDALIRYYYRRTNNPKSFFPNLPSSTVNDNEYEVWLWNMKQKKVLDIRTGGIEPMPIRSDN